MLPPLLAGRARRESARRGAATAIVVVAATGLLSTLTPLLRVRFASLLEVLPLAVPLGARTVLVPVSVALLLLARGVRRGQRLGWALTMTLLSVSAVLHLAKGVDVLEALLDVGLVVWLATHGRAFPVLPAAAAARRAVWVLVVGGAVTAAVSAGLVLLVGVRRHPEETTRAVVERLVGDPQAPLLLPRGGPDHVIDPILDPALLALGLTLLVVLLWTLFGVRDAPRPTAEQRLVERERARAVVARWGGDTLDYFALRDDKDFFFAFDGVVAHAVRNGVVLVSPDPIGPPEHRGALLVEFLAHVERHGWSVAVVGARADWLPLYEATGLRPVYLGDEAVLDCQAFSLSGRSMKSLRGAVNRVAKAGVTVTFHEGAALPPAEAEQLRAMAGQSRRSDAERGFSMTLSRLFDPADTGVLVSVARLPDGRPAGFVQWVPAADIDGYSLDVMRRSTAPDVPNGITDHLIVATAQHLASRGQRGLGLNFAVLREVVAGQDQGRRAQLHRRAVRLVSRGTQLESLWRFNAKYDPQWRPRYVVLDAVEVAAAQGLTIADAEGLAELPVIGRFLGRRPVTA